MIYQNRWIFILLVLISCSLIAGCGGDEEMEAVSTPKITAVGSIQGTVSPAVGNAEVQLLKDGQPIATTRADANGRYAFTDLQPDTYEIRAVAAGYKPHSPQTVTVVGSQTLTSHFTLERLVTTLKGIVVAPDGLAIENAAVTVKSAKGERTQNTDQLGIFTFDEIWEDVELTVTVQVAGMEEQTLKVDALSEGETAKLQIDLVAIPDVPDDNPDGPKTGSQVGDLAPDLTLSNIDGKPITLSDYREKKMVLLNFNRGQF